MLLEAVSCSLLVCSGVGLFRRRVSVAEGDSSDRELVVVFAVAVWPGDFDVEVESDEELERGLEVEKDGVSEADAFAVTDSLLETE